jgi:glycerol-3-phosphate acyltransferase PlsY
VLSPLSSVALATAGYLLGSIPTGALLARARGIDIQKVGSGNIGATNVARTLGKKLGALVLLLDTLKGLVPVLACRLAWPEEPQGAALVGVLATLGHVFPVWLKLRGGKGVATALGVFLALAPLCALVSLLTYVAVYATWRVSSAGSLIAATALPLTLFFRHEPTPYIAAAALLWALVVIKHRTNIQRLLHHQEGKL